MHIGGKNIEKSIHEYSFYIQLDDFLKDGKLNYVKIPF
jgi:hypothetical protein